MTKSTYNKRFEATWRPKEHRWQKMILGKRFYYSVDRTISKEASYKDAMKFFEIKKSQLILGIEPVPPENGFPVKDAISKHEKFRLLALAAGNTGAAANTQDKLDQLKTLPKNSHVDKDSYDPLSGVTNEGKLVWRELEKVVGEGRAKPKTLTIREAYIQFLKYKQAQVGINLSAKRYRILRTQLRVFLESLEKERDHIQPDSPFKDFKEADYERFFTFLSSQVTNEVWGKIYVKDIFGDFNQFMQWAIELDHVERPKNFRSRRYSFRIPQKEIVILEDDHVKAIIRHACPELKLYVLLALNCGYTSADIIQLKKTEVDWEKGLIRRKRSKTKHIDNVPVVTYKLWEETFSLLKQFKSEKSETVFYKPYEEKIGSLYRELHRTVLDKFPYISFKHLRKTGASLLATSPEHFMFNTYYLGHTGQSIAERHYTRMSDDRFFAATEWMKAHWGL